MDQMSEADKKSFNNTGSAGASSRSAISNGARTGNAIANDASTGDTHDGSQPPAATTRADATLPEGAREPARLSREAIVAAAFRAWGGTHFAVTSLSLVAQELAVTKPAVYRYFASKEELFTAMRRDYARRLEAQLLEPLTGAIPSAGDLPDGTPRGDLPPGGTPRGDLPPGGLLPGSAPPYGEKRGDSTPDGEQRGAPPPGGTRSGRRELMRAYVSELYRFFEQNPYHYAFFVRYLLGRPLQDLEELAFLADRHEALLLRHLHSPEARRYLSGTASYWTTEHYRCDPVTGTPRVDPSFRPEALQLDEAGREMVINRILERLEAGFLPRNHRPVDLRRVERTAWFLPEEMPAPDRVLSAVEQIVQEQGYGGATVERIAERMGITKSSLYHYFRNRDDMLMQVVLRDQQHFAGLARIRLQQLEHPEEQLYALFVMIGSYAAQHTVFMTVENWIREHDVSVELPPDHVENVREIFTFLSKMVIDGRLTADESEAFSVIGFIRFLIMQELNVLLQAGQPLTRERCVPVVRRLFLLFSRGLGDESTTTGLPRERAPREGDLEGTIR